MMSDETGTDVMFRTFVENSPDVIVRYDLQGRRLYANPAWARLTGHDIREVLGSTVLELPTMSDPESYHLKLMAAATGQEEEIELMFSSPALGVRYIHARFLPERDADGRVRGMFVVGRDITERKHMENELKLKEFVLDQAHIGVYLIDENARITYVNDEACRSLGYSRDELLTKTTADIDASYTLDQSLAVRQKTLSDGDFTFETMHIKRDGSLLPVEVGASILEYQGQTMGVALVVDITERKHMETTLAAREREFRTLAESSPDLIIRYDLEQRILYLNDNLLHMLALNSVDEVIGRPPHEIWPDGRFDMIESASLRAITSGEAQEVEIRWEVQPGQQQTNQIIVVPERDAIGRIIGTIAIGRDVSNIRDAERRLAHFVESLPGLAYTFRLGPDGSMRFTYVSPGVTTYYGLTPEEAMADFSAIHDAAHPDDRSRIEDAIAESASTLTPYQVESRVCRAGLPERWLDVRSVPVPEPDGGILWYGIMLDITDRKLMEAAREKTLAELRLNENRLAEAQRIGCMGSWELDLLSGQLGWSDEIYRIFEIDKAVFGADYEAFLNAIHPDDREAVNRTYTESLKSRKPYYAIDHRLLFPDGRVKHVRETSETHYDEHGTPLLSHGTVQDITEIKETQLMLERSQAELRQLAAHRGTVLENERRLIAREMHEELAQVLAAMRMKLSQLRSIMCDDVPAAEPLIGDMLVMTEDTISKIRNMVGGMRPTTLEIGIVPTLEWLVENITKHTTIDCHLITPQEEPNLTDTQVTLLFRLMQEALNNVVQHAEAGHVDITLKEDGEYYLLSLEDDGKGITPEDLLSPGFGIISMREQATTLGGVFTITPRPHGGVVVSIRFPHD